MQPPPQIKIPRSWEYVEEIKVSNLLILRQGDYSGLSGWAQFNHKGPYKWKRNKHEAVSGKKKVKTEPMLK